MYISYHPEKPISSKGPLGLWSRVIRHMIRILSCFIHFIIYCQKRQGTNNDIQNTTPKTKERAERTTLTTGGEVRSSGGGMVGGKQFLLNM
jgi:hypothetical protein